MSYSRHYRPALKNSVDVQLQTAFSDGNWQTVIRLADKRAKSLKDPYYDAIKLCAQSQLDTANDQYSVMFAVDDLVSKGTTIKDLDTIELYEWACEDKVEGSDYGNTFGILRSRYVKANPKAIANGISCLQACLLHWDLVNAQQIAAVLDKASANSNDRRPMFWNITLTYLLSISPQCPDGKQKLFGLLASKQLEKAAELSEKSDDDLADRGLRTEEELYLYYRVLARNGSTDNYLKQILHPELGAMKQFEQGKKQLFLEALDVLEAQEKWDEIFDFCRQGLSLMEDEDVPSYLAADWRVWRRFIAAASKKSNDEAAFKEVQQLLQTFVSTKTKTAQMYKKNIALAVIETHFHLPESLLSEKVRSDGLSPRVAQICLYLDNNYDRLSAFNDLKSYVEELTFEESKYLVEVMIPKLLESDPAPAKSFLMKVLELKFRYLLTTCPQSRSELPSVVSDKPQPSKYRCRFCGNEDFAPCTFCLESIVSSAASTRQAINADAEFVKTIPKLDKDPRSDLSMLIGLCLIKLAKLTGKSPTGPAQPALQEAKTNRFLQAVLVLDAQLQETPNDNGLRLLLVKLYLLLGCASYAYKLWTPLDVKRTIQDALSPHFFDRISTLSPSLFLNNRFFAPLWSYYTNTLRDPCPMRIWDAFSTGSYSSILDMTEYDDRLRRSCTVVMTVVEERQAATRFRGRLDDPVHEISLVANVTDDTELVNAIDYGSFTNLESRYFPAVQDLVQLGPALSNERSHLALLTAQCRDVINYRSPKDYKPAKQQDIFAKEVIYNIEMLSRVHNSMMTFLHDKSTPAKLTSAEDALYTFTALLAGFLATAFTHPRSPEPLPASVIDTMTALKTILTTLRTEFHSGTLFDQFTDMHTLSCLLDVAVSMRQSVVLIGTWHEREQARDRSGKSGCHKDIIGALKAFDGLAVKAMNDVKLRIKTLKEKLGEGGWLDKILDWTFDQNDGSDDKIGEAVESVIGGRGNAEEWAGKVFESWNEGVTGWTLVKME